MIPGGEIASYLAIAMGIVYLIVDLRSKRLTQTDRISMIFTIVMGTYIMIVGMLAILQRKGTIGPELYAAVIWAFVLTLLPMSLYLTNKKRTRTQAD